MDEYRNLPDYVTRCLSQQLVNAAVRRVSDVLVDPSGAHFIYTIYLYFLLFISDGLEFDPTDCEMQYSNVCKNSNISFNVIYIPLCFKRN